VRMGILGHEQIELKHVFLQVDVRSRSPSEPLSCWLAKRVVLYNNIFSKKYIVHCSYPGTYLQISGLLCKRKITNVSEYRHKLSMRNTREFNLYISVCVCVRVRALGSP
jgi:hypothetical protein